MSKLAALLPVVALLLAACPAPTRPSVDLTWPHGVQAAAAQELAIVEQQPGEQAPLDVRAAFLGKPGYLLPAGTRVVRTPADDPDASRTQSSTVDPAYNAWIRVRVLESPVQDLVGRAGWVYAPGLTTQPAPAPAVTTQLIARPDRLCDAPRQGAACAFDVGPGMPAQLVACEGAWARLGVWAPGGAYVEGFLPGEHLSPDPCQATPTP